MSHPMLETVNSKIPFLNEVALQFAESKGFTDAYVFKANVGKKYIKITRSCTQSSHCSVWCFIDDEGKIFKPASFSAPTKNFPRGTVEDFDNVKFVTDHIYGF